jgi:peptidyl-prolyl cis-trans isomerase B (cyclophilin B)
MTKSGIFIGIVLLGALAMIPIFNQGEKNQKIPATATQSPFQTSVPTPSATTSSPTISPTETTKMSLEDLAIIKTSKGDITLTLYPTDAPKTVANFIAKAKSGFYNNLTFHRVEDWVVQGGDPLGTGTGGGDMPTELNDKPFIIGSLGVARGQDIKISNDAQFFITKKDSVFLNGQYTNFGIVTKGMDVVEKIEVGDKILQISIE